MPAMTWPLAVTMVAQLGKQTAWGTPVAASKYLAGLSLKMKPAYESERKRNEGEKVSNRSVITKKEVQGEFEMPLDFNALIYVLSSAIKGAVSPSTVDTNGRTWTFTENLTGPESPDAFTAEIGDSVRAFKVTDLVFDDLTFTFGRAGLGLKGSAFGSVFTDGITMTGGPSTIAVLPAQPAMGYLKLGTTWQPAGSSEYAAFFSAELKLGKRYDRAWNTKTGQLGWGAITETAHEPEMTIVVAADATGMGYLTNLENQARVYARIGYVSSAGNGGAEYLVGSSTAYAGCLVDVSGQIVNSEDLGEGENGLRVVKWKMDLHKDSAGKLLEIAVTNGLTAL